MRRPLSPGKIAIYLATAGEKYPAQIAKGTGLSNGRIGDAIPRLFKFGLVKKRELKKYRTGLAIIGYSLTLKGLVIVLHDQPKLWKKIDEIVLKHRLMGPLVFKKWDKFVKTGARNIVFNRLQRAFISLAQAHYAYPSDRKYGADDIEYIDYHVLRMDTVFAGKVFSEAEIASFISVLSTDPDLKSFVIKHNEEDIKTTVWLLENRKAYGRAIRENRPKLFLSKLEHRDPLRKQEINKRGRAEVRQFERKIEPRD